MRAAIDTSSLLMLVRYYLPFEKNDKLRKLIEKKLNSGELIIIDKVHEEAKYQSKGIILKELDFLNEKSKHIKTSSILPDAKFISQLENQLCYGAQKNRLTPVEFEVAKNKFLDTADAKLIIYCDKEKNAMIDKPILVTEESRSENDSKLFKKLPEICDLLSIEHCNLPTLLKTHFGIKLSDYLE
ncbi:MAG TPA: DUF4411 family protein [Bacteroidia bacterium]|jgi:hypothetical protein|nr:DUF4411 family protein [Bacteroidia bacterium]